MIKSLKVPFSISILLLIMGVSSALAPVDPVPQVAPAVTPSSYVANNPSQCKSYNGAGTTTICRVSLSGGLPYFGRISYYN
jgi:hypothetical protein